MMDGYPPLQFMRETEYSVDLLLINLRLLQCNTRICCNSTVVQMLHNWSCWHSIYLKMKVSALKVPAGFHCCGSTEPFMWPISALLLAASLRYLQFLAPLESNNQHCYCLYVAAIKTSINHRFSTKCSLNPFPEDNNCMQQCDMHLLSTHGSVTSCVCPDVWPEYECQLNRFPMLSKARLKRVWEGFLGGGEGALEWHLSMIRDDSHLIK